MFVGFHSRRVLRATLLGRAGPAWGRLLGSLRASPARGSRRRSQGVEHGFSPEGIIHESPEGCVRLLSRKVCRPYFGKKEARQCSKWNIKRFDEDKPIADREVPGHLVSLLRNLLVSLLPGPPSRGPTSVCCSPHLPGSPGGPILPFLRCTHLQLG